MGRKREHNERNICYLVYCKWNYQRKTTSLAFFITPEDIDKEEEILYGRGLRGVFNDFYRIKILNESKYLDYVKLLEERQHFTYVASKDVYVL